jgi:hypothetical protein
MLGLAGRHGASEVVALSHVTAVLPEKRRLRRGFNAFGNHSDSEALSKAQHRFDNCGDLTGILGRIQ